MNLGAYGEQLEECRAALNPENVQEEIHALDDQMAAPDFWNDVDNANKISQRQRQLQNKLERFQKLKSRFEDLGALIEMAEENNTKSARTAKVVITSGTDKYVIYVTQSMTSKY